MEAHFQIPCHCHHSNRKQQHQYTYDKQAHYLDNRSLKRLASKECFRQVTQGKIETPSVQQLINRQKSHMAVSNAAVILVLNHLLHAKCVNRIHMPQAISVL